MAGKIVRTIFGDFTFDRARHFQRAYQRAVRREETSFYFGGGQWYDVVFAKYLVEFLGLHFPLETTR